MYNHHTAYYIFKARQEELIRDAENYRLHKEIGATEPREAIRGAILALGRLTLVAFVITQIF